MFAKQFSEAGGASTGGGQSGGRRPGRGRGAGSGLGAGGKGKRGGRGTDDGVGDSGGLFNMDNNYRTHMLFPGRKDEDGCGGEPRRSSGSPSFMKAMMSWGKRPSDPKAAQGNAQELARLRGTPTRGSESEFEHLLSGDPPLNAFRKTVSFHNFQHTGTGSDPEHVSPPRVPLTRTPPSSFFSTSSPSSPSSPTNNSSSNNFFSYNEPFRDHDYASYIGGNASSSNICFILTNS